MPVGDARPARAALSMLDVTIEDVWLDYVGLGGALTLTGLADFLADRSTLSDTDYDRLAQAINELFMDRDDDHPFPYAEEVYRAQDQ